MTANPARRGEMSPARPNGSLRTIAVITAVNRAPRAALFRAPRRRSTATSGSFPGPGDRRLACRWPAGQAALANYAAAARRGQVWAADEAMTENLAYYPRHGYSETHRAQQDGFQRFYFCKPLGRL